ncbi:hypothetical protein RJ639_017615 [Escallonia herrerae]|uniref:DUF2921 domain-containing protein n=1 Tax=Escallonia herrerae TaxID=1293975 RepID=A0AA88VCG8_9ASTE|nr:hypothetical protein RJ639_017615 [Escallonia herrerae]
MAQASFFLLLFATTSIPSTTATVSYSDHCASVVPEATPTHPERGTLLSIRTGTSQYKGGERILGKNSSFSFYPNKAISGAILTGYATSTAGVYTVEGRVRFSSSNLFYLMSNLTPRSPTHSRFRARLGSLSFQLNGLWSQSSGKLCVVGSGSWYTKEGYHLNLDAVLKLNFAKNSSISTSLVTGLLESLSFPNKTTYFEPISILAFPPMKQYQYTLLSEESIGFSGDDDVPTNSSLSLRPGGICSMLSWRFRTFKLKYESKCLQNCTPLGDTIGYVPSLMSLYAIQCSKDEQKLRYLIEFPNNSYVSHSRAFDHTATLVGEGTWDGRKNQLAVIACRILDATGALSSAHLGDCSIRLSLRYPATWSIAKSITIEGQIWTNKTTNDSGYFNKITFHNSDNSVAGAPGVKYEYTEMERVKRSCQVQRPVKKKWETYPKGNSSDMRFDLSVKSSQGNTAWGYGAPVFVGDQFYEGRDSVVISDSALEFSEVQSLPSVEVKTSSTGPVNISYRISLRPLNGVKLGGRTSFFNKSLSPNRQAEIWAEGVYDDETGHLCMVGCRNADSDAESLDCEILVKFQSSCKWEESRYYQGKH